MRKKVYLAIFIQFAFLSVFSLWVQAKAPSKIARCKNTPKLTVVIVIDQLAFHYIPKLQKYFKYGLKDLFDNGVVYYKAYHPHGVPETTPGHHGLSVGTCPKDHGAIANDWLGPNGEDVKYVNDPEFSSLTSVEPGHGYSSRNTKVDGLSDQFMFKSNPNCTHKVYALSLKSYPAVSMAGKLGKPFWLDSQSGEFTSSKAYFKKLPDWVIEFNQLGQAEELKNTVWTLMYPEDADEYDFPFIKNYDYAGLKNPMIGSNSDKIISKISSQKYYMFMKTPQSSELLLKFAQKCIDSNFDVNSNAHLNDKMILWLSLSNLDLLCHFYGPDSLESTDLIYHIDKQLKDFFMYLNKKIGEKNYLLVLTADHGICPIPEIAQKQGFYQAKRIAADPLVAHINKIIREKFGLDDFEVYFEPTCFRIKQDVFAKLSVSAKQDILKTITDYLRSIPGIKNVWTFDELQGSTFQPHQLESFYKNQLYAGRSGDIICQPEPYSQITKYPTGTSHMTPYDYDTHVPLIVYQNGRFEKKKINKKVWIPQLPATLACILHVGQPSASIYDLLPGLNY